MKAIAALALLALTACGSLPADAGFPEVQNLVGERMPGQRVHWYRGGPEDADVEKAITGLLASPLTPEGAVQIALLNNRNLQATYEDLGVAQADLVQAGLLSNPVLSASLRGGGKGFDVVYGFLELLFMPARKQIQSENFEGARLRVADQTVRLAGETRSAYYDAVAAGQAVELRRLIADAAGASAEMAKRLHDAGNISELAWTLERTSAAETRRSLALAEEAALAARERLNRLMGLWGTRTVWTLPERLADIPAEEAALDKLESLAVAQRLDLAAARSEVRALQLTLKRKDRSRGFGGVEAGGGVEKEAGAAAESGPELKLPIPLFDQGQAGIRRLEAQLRQADRRYEALAVEIRSEVREHRGRVLLARQRVEHALKETLPLKERAVELAQQQFNAMLIGVFDLIDMKRKQYDAYHEFIESVRDYWIARSALSQAAGGSLERKD